MTDLPEVQRAAADWRAARERLDREIRKARKKGASLRAIAEAAGVTHETVRTTITKGGK
jgi:hypothetical protein